MIIDKCHILAPFKHELCGAKDGEGCLKPSNHTGAHISKLDDGRYIEWEDDPDDVCKIYSFLTEDEVAEVQE